MESIYQDIKKGRLEDPNEILQRLEDYLDNGGDIDFLFSQEHPYLRNEECIGTILHHSIIKGYESSIVKYILSKGANIACKITSNFSGMRFQNALELATYRFLYGSSHGRSNFEMLKQRTLELYSSHGLTPLHINCAIEFNLWSEESAEDLDTADVNATVSIESPIWPGMTPLLIAAKLENLDLISRLLDLGAEPHVRDPEGNTPQHYLSTSVCYYEELFFNNGRNTFGPFIGETHFHIACRFCPKSLDIVKRYLDQGISPDLPIQSNGCKDDPYAGMGGLHLAARANESPALILLLLYYGAEVNRKDSNGKIPIEYAFDYCNDLQSITCICIFIEAGSNVEEAFLEGHEFLYLLNKNSYMLVFLKCIIKLVTLNKNLLSEPLMTFYLEKSKMADYSSELNKYTMDCLKELKDLPYPGLRQILDETIIVKADYKERFRRLDSFDFKSYPIYGLMLSLKMKRKLREYDEKKERITPQALLQMQSLVQSLCYLPQLCAENILWNLSVEELDQFMPKFLHEV